MRARGKFSYVLPFNTQHRLRKMQEVCHSNKIDKSISDITSWQASYRSVLNQIQKLEPTILEVHPQVKEINLPRTDSSDEIQQVLVAHLVRNVLDHHCSPRVSPLFDLLNVQHIFLAGLLSIGKRGCGLVGGR